MRRVRVCQYTSRVHRAMGPKHTTRVPQVRLDLAMEVPTKVRHAAARWTRGYFNNPLSRSHSVKRSGQPAAALGLASCR
jgi:hypothetical protein